LRESDKKKAKIPAIFGTKLVDEWERSGNNESWTVQYLQKRRAKPIAE
jgi:hypothetical protein